MSVQPVKRKKSLSPERSEDEKYRFRKKEIKHDIDILALGVELEPEEMGTLIKTLNLQIQYLEKEIHILQNKVDRIVNKYDKRKDSTADE